MFQYYLENFLNSSNHVNFRDGCVSCGNVCPISAGTESTYSAVIMIHLQLK